MLFKTCKNLCKTHVVLKQDTERLSFWGAWNWFQLKWFHINAWPHFRSVILFMSWTWFIFSWHLVCYFQELPFQFLTLIPFTSRSLHLFHLPVKVYIYSIYQSALHLFRLPVSFTFIPFPVWLTLFHLPVQFTFIPATPLS